MIFRILGGNIGYFYELHSLTIIGLFKYHKHLGIGKLIQSAS